MKNKSNLVVFLVDDDLVYLKALEILFLNNTEHIVETFPTGELCLENIYKCNPDVVILDYHLNGIEKNAINGLKVLKKIKKINKSIPVIMLSSQDKIEVARKCLKHKAFEYVVKSETAFLRIKKILSTIIKYQKIKSHVDWYQQRI